MAMALFAIASPASAANYTVNNTNYMNVFNTTGINSNFNLNGTDYTFQDGDAFTFLSGIYTNVQIILDKTVNLISNGAFFTNETTDYYVINILDTAIYSNITGFNINGSLNVSADNVTLNNNSINASTREGIIINSNNVTLVNNRINNSKLSGINTAGNNTNIINNTFVYNLQNGVTSTGNNTTITGNTIYCYNNSSINSTGADAIINNNHIFRRFFVNNTTYTNIFNSTGIADTFNLNGTDYTFQDGDTFTFLEGIYENVKIILNKPVAIIANGSVNLTSNGDSDIIHVLNTANNTNVSGFYINGSLSVDGNNSIIDKNTIVNSSRDGILISASNVTLSNNNIKNSNSSGVKSTGNNVVIRNNHISSSNQNEYLTCDYS